VNIHMQINCRYIRSHAYTNIHTHTYTHTHCT
jgi:hypothetical protein